MGTLEPIALSPRDAAAFLGISKRTMSRLIRADSDQIDPSLRANGSGPKWPAR